MYNNRNLIAILQIVPSDALIVVPSQAYSDLWALLNTVDDDALRAVHAANIHIVSSVAHIQLLRRAMDRELGMTATRLREILELLDWTQRGLARRLERQEGEVRQWARGGGRVPHDVGDWLEELAAFHTANPPPPKS